MQRCNSATATESAHAPTLLREAGEHLGLLEHHRVLVQLSDGLRQAVRPVGRRYRAGSIEARRHPEHIGYLEHGQPGRRLQDRPRERLVQLVSELARWLGTL